MGAPKTPKINELEYNGRTSNKKGAGQKKMSESQTKAGNQKKFENLKKWKFEKLNSKFKMA